ncbi:hypothetical protein PTTG_27487 [Puccinia triticina 1-1 BBBD Race 1]|uniref:Uncharacterized protein n=2 Tax=Puccinia triticina TaxID=208348 RepID=A0A180GKG3_PUCT1|nr:uncharacterized protein PtA15_6A651 [Puccinia triticina]OAV92948.1 hypothetical protein PTTG_27487 [Puccinia triticina 1-1 BBBD Race 1]WAQ86021.1 hypothetical protein PtA15_6A651 [Puccinia triticina]WAR55916.1 hypothetical protein PtB15_6B660 [Puccinia triticina]
MQFSAMRMAPLSILVIVLVTLAWTSQSRQLRPAKYSYQQLPNRFWRRRVHMMDRDSFVSGDSSLGITTGVENFSQDETRDPDDFSDPRGLAEVHATFVRAIPIQ